MNKYRLQYGILLSCMFVFSCADQLDVKNPNQPTASNIKTENDIISLGLGTYYSGWTGNKFGGFAGTFLTDVISYHSGMGDEIGVEAANVYINQLVMPDWVQLDDNSKVNNPANPNTQLGLLRLANVERPKQSEPMVYYEWSYIYMLNNHCNALLGLCRWDNVLQVMQLQKEIPSKRWRTGGRDIATRGSDRCMSRA